MPASPALPKNPDGAKTATDFHLVQASRLKTGSRLKFPIQDGHDLLLLAQGQIITPTFLALLKKRGVLLVKVHASEIPRICAGEPQGTAETVPEHHDGALCSLSNAGTEMLDEKMREGLLSLPPQGEAFARELQTHAGAYDEQAKERFVEAQEQGVAKIREVFQSLLDGRGLDLNTLTALADDALKDIAEDSDLYALLGCNPFSEGYPARHSLNVCMLALTIGTRLQLDRQTLKELAIGCLIHDSGMLKLNPKAYQTAKQLTPIEFLEITKHPVIVFDMMKDMQAVPFRSAFIAYQIHERCDGSGYPRQRGGMQIHFLSKVAAAADAYVGLVSHRAHRPALLPYFAMEALLKGARDQRFDCGAVRALLQTISLFPLGSYVLLSDGRVGRTIRANGDAYTSPIVEAWRPEDRRGPPEVVNLLETDVRVVSPLTSLEPDGRPLCAITVESAAGQTEVVALPPGAEQRRHMRRTLVRPVRIFSVESGDPGNSGPPVDAMSSDISEGGLAFVHGQKLEADQIVVDLKPGEGELRFLSKIVSVEQIEGDAWQYGVKFVRQVLPAGEK